MDRKPTKQEGKKTCLPFQPITLHNDAPIDRASDDVDFLNFTPLAKEVAAIAVGTDGPFTMAVTAKWGYGKTSMLGLVKDLIEQYGEAKNEEWRATHTTVWFNAWQYEREEEPIIPLLLAIQDAVARNVSDHRSFLQDVVPNIFDLIKKLPSALGDVASGFKLKSKVGTAVWLQALTGIKGEIELEAEPGKIFDALAETLSQERQAKLPESAFMQAIHELSAISEDILAATEEAMDSADRPKIVVFVDDLDRCHPDSALRLLDGIKLVLNQAGFVFVLALDKTILEEFLVRRYKQDYGSSNPQEVGRRYIDKIIQLEIPLPPQAGRFAGSTDDQRDYPTFSGKGYLKRIALKMLDRAYALQVSDVIRHCAYLSPRDVTRLLLRLRLDLGLYKSLDLSASTSTLKRLLLPDVAVAAKLTRLMEDACTGKYRNDFLDLISDDTLGRKLWSELSKSEWQTLDPTAEEDDSSESLSITGALVEAISKRRGLSEALTIHGDLWLSNIALRKRLSEFMNPVEEEAAADSAQLALVREAIRRSVNLREGEPSLDDWLTVRALSLSAGLNDKGVDLISKCTSLESLDLSGTRVSNLEPLSKLRNLKQLDIEGTRVSNLAPLSNLSVLDKLTLSGSYVTNLLPLAECSSLRTLYLARTEVEDVSSLSKLIGLKELSLWKTKVSDVAPLLALKNLTFLDLSETLVLDKDKSALFNALPKLKPV